MSETYASGTWKPNSGSEEQFVEAWSQFASWSSTMPGSGRLRLTRDLNEPGRFVSFSDWETKEAADAWKSAPDFREQLAQVLQYVEEFHSTNLSVVVTAEDGRARSEQAESAAV